MFGKSDKLKRRSGVTTLIAEGTEVLGDIRFEGNLEIEGCVKGSILAVENSGASMRIMENGRVEGDVYVPNVVINGTVIGEVHSSQYFELASKAVVEGNVYYDIFEMERGAQVNGNLIHTATLTEDEVVAQAVKDSKAKKSKKGQTSDELKFGSALDKKAANGPHRS